MPRTPRRELSLREKRRRFLKQIAATSVIASAGTIPVIAQDKTEPRRSTLGSGEVPLADALARYAIDLKYEDLREEIVRIAKRTILDTSGCAFGGYTAGPSKIAIKLASDVTAKRGACAVASKRAPIWRFSPTA